MLDIADTTAPRSDQMNADDLLAGPRTFTVADVRKTGVEEQPVEVVLAEFPNGRPFKPSKSMRRVMVMAWGRDASTYVGKRLTLYRDPAIRFGPDAVGGVRISHMSDLPGGKTLRLALTVTRGKRALFTVEPLPHDTPASPAVTAETLAELTDTFRRKGIAEKDWLAGVNYYTHGKATALDVITEEQARQMLSVLDEKPDASPLEPVDDALDAEDPGVLWPPVKLPGDPA